MVSFNRDIPADVLNTNQELRSRTPFTDDRNWLGHKRGAGTGKIDELLMRGATLEELETVRGAVHEHIQHLRKDHGLLVEFTGKIYKIIRT